MEETKTPREVPKNLMPWKKGESPTGHNTHPNGKQLKTLIKQVLTKKLKLEDAINGGHRIMTINEGIVLKLMARALQGNLKAIEMIFDRIDGKPSQKIEQEVVTNTITHDLSRLAPEELLKLRDTVQKIEVETANYEENQEVTDLEIITETSEQ